MVLQLLLTKEMNLSQQELLQVGERMPFGLRNATDTFQMCMLAIFHDMIEESVEVFMDDFFVFGSSFDHCLNNLDKMLQRCKDAHLVLNWEKCHFMVKEGIVLGHKVSEAGLEVDKAKIDVISKLPPPTNIKGIRSFLGHASFYQIFIKYFSKITCLLTKLLEKDTPFKFNDECQNAFKILKEKLTCAPVIVSPNWSLPFKLMCDASDFAVGAALADHLSRIENEETSDDSEVDDNFTGETLTKIITEDEPWFAKFTNYLASDIIPKGMTYQQKNFFSQTSNTTSGRNPTSSKYVLTQSKLRSCWLGPYVVKHQYPSGNVELYGKDGKMFIVNGHRLKLKHEEEDYNDQSKAVTPFFPKE
ncbi:reverse transcriptase domain-containing protein [Tanacetum coccineum]